ncbi:alternative ribosome-rescue factor A [Alginatibacterium sediminis]|uniref:Alternative ribosome-rescue factor A n=1 Tax=Alginatibacterium sediminis TaxID=2164068 RepID=A0A420E9W2_9ALTE|nr:alternative ribosome rescue factor ArfA [Alginatibacterium sediminis]RKF17464.1 alternative ribosome-rescue factor A [Alginatibacterium sediminis]
MSKSKTKAQVHDLQRGEIKHNAFAAMVTSPLFKAKAFKNHKGKGSYQRNGKHKGQEPYSIAA